MNIKELIPALLLAAVGLALTVWSVFIILSNSNVSILNLKGPVVLAVAGILLVSFAIFYVKTADRQYREEDEDEDEFEDEFEDELGIVWEECEEEDEDEFEDERVGKRVGKRVDKREEENVDNTYEEENVDSTYEEENRDKSEINK